MLCKGFFNMFTDIYNVTECDHVMNAPKLLEFFVVY